MSCEILTLFFGNYNMQEFKQMVTNLAKNGQDILDSLDAKKCHMLHMAVGIAGEAGELSKCINKGVFGTDDVDLENLVEELGDINFHIEGLVQSDDRIVFEQITMYERLGLKPNYIVSRVVEESAEVLDLVKKHVIYNKELDVYSLNSRLEILSFYLSVIYKESNISFIQTVNQNMNKLLKGRYKTGTYSDEQAQDRADKQEENK